MYKLKRKKRQEMFSACQRREDGGSTHFDIRWRDGPLRFTGKLELLTSPNQEVQELAMYDDYINYYGFPRELGFIRVKRLLKQRGEVRHARNLRYIRHARVDSSGSSSAGRCAQLGVHSSPHC